MLMLQYLVFVSALFVLAATFTYIRSMFKGKAKPNRVTWLLWSVAPLIAVAASLSDGVGWPTLPVFMAGFGPFLIFIASYFIKDSYWKLSGSDYACGILSAMAIVLWMVTNDPGIAIIFAIGGDALAAVPTLLKCWYHPNTESPWPYAAGVFGSLTSFAAAVTWTFSEYAFPAYLLVANLMLIFSIYRKSIASHFGME
jgi:hypothetical protein